MTPRRSVRAAARRVYSTMGRREEALAPEVPRKVDGQLPAMMLTPHASTPTPDPSPQGGGEQATRAAGETTDLMARARALYEGGTVPVAEIARLCGVTERTIYKYAAKGQWRPRYRWEAGTPGARPAPLRGEGWKASPGLKSVKGAGGRFIAREQADRPVARGLKALDPRARAQADAACAAAAAVAAAARARAEILQLAVLRSRALADVVKEIEAQDKFRTARQARRQRRYSAQAQAEDDSMEEYHAMRVENAAGWLRYLQRRASPTVTRLT